VAVIVTRRLKVAHVATIDLTLRVLLIAQLRALRDAGYEVTAISAPGPWTDDLTKEGIRHIPWPHATRSWNLVSDTRAFLSLLKIFRRERFDLVHTHNPKPGIMGRIAGRMARIPCVMNTAHGVYATPEDRLPKRAAVVGLEWIAARFSDLDLYQSGEDLEWMRRLHVVSERRSELLGNGTDLHRFDPQRIGPEHIAGLKAELGIASDAVVVGTIGRLVAEKGFRELFAAFERVRADVPAAVLLVVGDSDPAKADALSPVEIPGRENGVVVTGWRDDVPALLAMMDVFVLASWREGMPRSAIEAAAMGKPLVLTNIRGCREVARHEVEGLLVPPRNPDELADAMVRTASDEALRRRLGAAARARAVKLFDEDRVAATVVARTEELLTKKVGRQGAHGTGDNFSRRARLTVKRLADVVVAGLSLLVLSPVVLATAAVVALSIGRPVLFRQPRLGYRGRPFRLLKFRTMTDQRDEQGRLLPDAQRLTRTGKFLRQWSLDELPGLINVLRGEMSMVGPRPLLPEYWDLYTPEQRRRHDLPPGMAGPVPAGGRNALTWEEKFELDRWYVDNWSLGLDVKTFAQTLWKVVTREGISASNHATMPRFEGAAAPADDGKQAP
jgi:lipopolysaccharide/colanic/teichoic acid biosynthesis glycosyltransferase/glycosyltransferase involved in cell wall biosynthesis